MPKHSDFQKVYDRFLKQYGSEKGEKLYYSWANKHKYDDSKPMPNKSKKESVNCIIKGVEIKEVGNEFHVMGFLATDHLDEQGDIIPKVTMDSFSTAINNGSANICGTHHSEAKTGVYQGTFEKNSKVLPLADGHYGLWVDTKYELDNPLAKSIIDQWQNGSLNSFSITYDTDGCSTCDFEVSGDGVTRIIGPETVIFGGTGTDMPANENAVATSFSFKELKEVYKTEEKKMESVIENKPAEKKEVEVKKEEVKEIKSAEPVVDLKSITKEIKENLMKELAVELKESLKAKSPMQNMGAKSETKELETKELEAKERILEFKEMVLENKGTKRQQLKACAEMKSFLKKNKMFDSSISSDYHDEPSLPFEIKETAGTNCFPKIAVNSRIETKGIPTHVTTDDGYSGGQTSYVAALANYEQSPARYNDIYGPYIVNQLNDMTTLWNLLPKEDYSGMSSIGVRIRKGRNATASTYAYGSEPGWDSNSDIIKINLHFVTSYVEVAAEWEAMELAKGKGGIDVYQTEVDFGTKDLMNYLNGQLFGTGDGTSETAALGLEVLGLQTGNLYGRDRTSLTTLKSAGNDDLSSTRFSLDKARAMIEASEVNGADRNSLVFVTSLRQERLMKQMLQDMQRLPTPPTSNRIGFVGKLDIDGVPMFSDKRLDDDSKTDDIYLLDTSVTKIALKKAPTYVEMAQISLHRRGIVWMMWNMFCDAPNHNYWVYGAATS